MKTLHAYGYDFHGYGCDVLMVVRSKDEYRHKIHHFLI